MSRIGLVALDEGTAAQLVAMPAEFGGGGVYRVQVAEAIPPGLRAAVARHLIETHALECCTRSCELARTWLSEPACTLRETRLA